MGGPFHYKLRGNNCWLSPERMLFWEEEKALVVADMHFGKTGHFRKSGIAVPQALFREDLQRMVSQLQYFQPSRLIVVGDLFHSRENRELDLFKKWRQDLQGIRVELIKGNHDILEDPWYAGAGIELHSEEWGLGNFSFCHDPDHPAGNPEAYRFSGHIHPGVRISGQGKQSLRFPCFFFGRTQCILPAFSHFTGMAIQKGGPEDHIFAIVNHSVIPF
jgi:uncharacterized protein